LLAFGDHDRSGIPVSSTNNRAVTGPASVVGILMMVV
jgi:hypothetical protein